MPLSTEKDAEEEKWFAKVDYVVYLMAYRLYRYRPFSVRSTLYFPESFGRDNAIKQNEKVKLDPRQYTLEMMPGNHETGVSKHADILAKKIREVLDRE